MSVDQELVGVLARTLEQTDELLESGETTWETALEGVGAVALDLESRFPAHAEWIRTQIAEWRRRRAH